MKKALVLGLGISGKSAVNHLLKKGYYVACVDDLSSEKISDVEHLSTKNITTLQGFDLFIPSPGIPRIHPLWVLAKKEKIEIAGEIELAMRIMQKPCIGVTGSNGKTTVVKMIEHCLNALGRKARALGNVGDPLLAYLEKSSEEEIFIVELSSFQLETLMTPALHVALILNISENHLDRYDNFLDYAKTKIHIQNCLISEGSFGVQRSVFSAYSHLFHRKTIDFSNPLSQSFEEDNQAAAFFALQHFGISAKEFFYAVKTFSKPKHRLEFIAEVNDVIYYNDSKATSPAAVDVALDFFKGKRIILLAGGMDKGGLSFAPLARHEDKIAYLIAFGQCGHKVASVLKHHIPKLAVSTVAEAVEAAFAIARKEEVVLFSPGGTSFDGFKDYAERGEEFRRCVMNLRRNI